MRKLFYRTLGVTTAAVVVTALAYGSVYAEAQKKADAKAKPPACNSLKDQAGCSAREDCTWVAAVMNEKTKKETRRAYCRTKPKAPAAKKTEKKA